MEFSFASYSIFEPNSRKLWTKGEYEYWDNYQERNKLKNLLENFWEKRGNTISILYFFKIETFDHIDFFKIMYLVKLQKEGMENISLIIDKHFLRSKGYDEFQILDLLKKVGILLSYFQGSHGGIKLLDYDKLRNDVLMDKEFNIITGKLELPDFESIGTMNYNDMHQLLVKCYIAANRKSDSYSILLLDIKDYMAYNQIQNILKEKAKIHNSLLLPFKEIPKLERIVQKNKLTISVHNIDKINEVLIPLELSVNDSATINRYFFRLFTDLVDREIFKNIKQQNLDFTNQSMSNAYKLKTEFVEKCIKYILEFFREILEIDKIPDVLELKGTTNIFDALRNDLRYEILLIIMQNSKEIEYADLLYEIRILNSNIDPSTISKAVKRLETEKLILVRDIEGSRKKYLSSRARSYKFIIEPTGKKLDSSKHEK